MPFYAFGGYRKSFCGGATWGSPCTATPTRGRIRQPSHKSDNTGTIETSPSGWEASRSSAPNDDRPIGAERNASGQKEIAIVLHWPSRFPVGAEERCKAATVPVAGFRSTIAVEIAC